MGLLEILIIVLLICWITGAFVVPVGGSAIHLLLVVLVIVLIVKYARGERVP